MLTICGGTLATRRRVMWCPVCERRRRFVQHFGGVYYDDIITCLGCGDSWAGGELGERPFRRGWRQEAIAEARRDWVAALSPREFDAVVDREFTESLGVSA